MGGGGGHTEENEEGDDNLLPKILGRQRMKKMRAQTNLWTFARRRISRSCQIAALGAHI